MRIENQGRVVIVIQLAVHLDNFALTRPWDVVLFRMWTTWEVFDA